MELPGWVQVKKSAITNDKGFRNGMMGSTCRLNTLEVQAEGVQYTETSFSNSAE